MSRFLHNMHNFFLSANYSQTGKTVNTRNISGMFLCCKKKPIRHEKTELQARTLISLWFFGYSWHVLIFAVIGHNTIKIPEIEFSSFCSFHTVTGKQSLSLSFQDSRGFWIFWGSEVWVRCHWWKRVMCKGLTVYLLLKHVEFSPF